MVRRNILASNVPRLEYELLPSAVSVPFQKPPELYFVHRNDRVHDNHGDSRRYGDSSLSPSVGTGFSRRASAKADAYKLLYSTITICRRTRSSKPSAIRSRTSWPRAFWKSSLKPGSVSGRWLRTAFIMTSI